MAMLLEVYHSKKEEEPPPTQNDPCYGCKRVQFEGSTACEHCPIGDNKR